MRCMLFVLWWKLYLQYLFPSSEFFANPKKFKLTYATDVVQVNASSDIFYRIFRYELTWFYEKVILQWMPFNLVFWTLYVCDVCKLHASYVQIISVAKYNQNGCPSSFENNLDLTLSKGLVFCILYGAFIYLDLFIRTLYLCANIHLHTSQ